MAAGAGASVAAGAGASVAAGAGASAAADAAFFIFSSLALSFSNVLALGLSCLVCSYILGFSIIPSAARNFATLSVGFAPTDNQYLILSFLIVSLSE